MANIFKLHRHSNRIASATNFKRLSSLTQGPLKKCPKAGLIGEIRKGMFSKDENIVFVHTGGSTALFAYEALFSEKAA